MIKNFRVKDTSNNIPPSKMFVSPLQKGLPLLKINRGIFLILLLLMIPMLSSCCGQQFSVQDGDESVIYYVCNSCSKPYDRITCMEILDEELKDERI
jgi:hypothetical protein